ncbi:hypothetical protein GQ600_9036 [Phytophthora cactorum]|nr:hypothetical protein GQ600_9036 [Phytophthora cactorum]
MSSGVRLPSLSLSERQPPWSHSAKVTSDEDSLRARLEEKSKESTPLHAAIEFWSRLRAILAANSHSTGIETLDRLVSKLLADDNFPAALEEDQALQSVHSGQGSTREEAAPGQEEGLGSFLFPPPDRRRRSACARLGAHRQDLGGLRQDASPHGVSVEGSPGLVPPQASPRAHLRHWRFWMRFRLLFLLLSLYPPTENAAARRKLKTNALQARLQLLSAFVGEIGYYGLLTAFEDTVHDNLMWFGGRAANVTGKVIANARDSFEVDSHGYRSIPEMLELSQALDPTRPNNLRLSDKALARIALDVATGSPPKENWVGNRNRGPWKELLSDRSLRVIQVEVAQLLTEGKPVVVHTERPFQACDVGDDDSDFEEDGEYTALKPSAPVRYKPPSSPEKNLARYLGLSSDEEDLKQEDGKSCFDQENEEDQVEAREDDEQEADEQEDEEGDDEAVDQQSPSDSNATPATTADSGKADQLSKASPTPASPRNAK